MIFIIEMRIFINIIDSLIHTLLIDINKLKNVQSLSLLNKYEGKNPYLKKLKRDYEKYGKVLTQTQANYIVDNHNVDPFLINKVINITEYLGEELKKNHNLSFTPKRILFQFILAETEKSYHIYGKLKQNQKQPSMYWIPKTQVLDDPYWEEPNVEVDFDKYANLDKAGRRAYKHQEEGIKFLLSRDGCILADDMGLGKTFQSIVAAIDSGAEKILIVCPSSMKIAWKREIESFGETASIINGKHWNPDKFTIINFDILKNFHTTKEKRNSEDYIKKGNLIHNEIVDEKFDLVIVDEAHNLKNHKSIRGKIMTEVCVDYGVDRVWLLTGTPVANRPMDFYNLLKIIKSPLADNWIFYVKRYCEGKKFYKKLKNGNTKQIWLTNGASNLEELATKSRNLLLRRLKEDVLDMPEKTIGTVYHQLTTVQRNNYDNLWEEYLLERKKKKKRGSVDKDLVELILLRKFMANETIDSTLEMVDNAIEQGQKVIVFTNFQEEQDIIMEKLGKIAVAHNGSMNETKKQVSVDRFQQDEKVKVFVGNIQSAGVGITLTAATTVIFNSLDWVPGNVKQAIDRAYRIGQKNNVSVYFNIYEDTVDERVWESLFQKSDVIGTILGDANNIFTSDDDEEFEQIIDAVIHDEAD